jgi:CRISPR-associated protein Cas1
LRVKTEKIVLNEFGSFLGAQEGCLLVRDKQKNVQKYPLFENEVGEIQVKMGNSVSSTALSTCALWGIDVLITSQRGKPIAYLRAIDDDSHVQTRISQYAALANGKGIEIAKQIIYGKAQGQNELLKKYGLRQHDLVKINEQINGIDFPDIKQVRRKLLPIEGHFTDRYFQALWPVFPKAVREAADKRMTWKAYDRVNNLFNLSYTFLRWRVHSAIIKAKMEPHLGFIHSEQVGKPSLVLDLMEIYRPTVDECLIQFTKKDLRRKDFIFQSEEFSNNKRGKREYLRKPLADELMQKLNEYFEKKVEIPRVKHGNTQELESLINEEAFLLAKYLRGEKADWTPRIVSL